MSTGGGGMSNSQSQGQGLPPPASSMTTASSSSTAGQGNKSLNDRLKAFLKGFSKSSSSSTPLGQAPGGQGAAGGSGGGGCGAYPPPQTLLLTEDLISDLAPTSPLPVRVKALQVITSDCSTSTPTATIIRRVEPHTLERLWTLTNDLVKSPDLHTRHTTLLAYTVLIESQAEKPGFLRAKLFSFIKAHDVPQDTIPRFGFLRALSDNGRNVSYFEEKIGPLLLSWLCSEHSVLQEQNRVPVAEFMGLLTNVVKFNSSYIDDDVLAGIIQNSCILTLRTTTPEDSTSCINLLNTIVMYSMIPPATLQVVIATLCRTVNVDTLCSQSWKVMRNLLGTHLGHSALHTLVTFMEAPPQPQPGGGGAVVQDQDINAVIRGAVFFTGVVLWGGGNRAVRSLVRGGSSGLFTVVLAAYIKVLPRHNALITFEVLLRTQDLLRNNADSLQVVGWDLVLDILERVILFASCTSTVDQPPPTAAESCSGGLGGNNAQVLMGNVHEALDLVELVLHTKTFCGEENRYWKIVGQVCHSRPPKSVEALLSHKQQSLLSTSLLLPGTSSPARYLDSLASFTATHIQAETRTPLRVRALQIIQHSCLQNQDVLEEPLLDHIILPTLKNIEAEPELHVRNQCVRFIVEFLMESRSKKGHDLLHFLEKVINRPFDAQGGSDTAAVIFTETEVADVLLAVWGIIKIFQRKVYTTPSSIAVTAYKILVKHLEKHYKRPQPLDACTQIRYSIFECFFRIRANALYHLGFPTELSGGNVESYSSYLAVDHVLEDNPQQQFGVAGGGGISQHGLSPPIQEKQGGATGGAPQVAYISLTAACKQVICCLKKEKDWKILELILTQLPHVMENKALILSRHGNDVDILASQLCGMVTDKSYFESSSTTSTLRNTPPKFSRSDLQSHVFPALTSLASYHSHLDTKIQQSIVKCLEHGLVSKSSSRICISALTTCTLEMKEVMHKLIPEILLSLSKISPKLNIAVPVLEFLSTLIHLPRVFASFVQDQYMSIFAICLPYTNPFKFNHYVVSLAHHVIALWFLKCRLSFRKGFVSYIIKGLESNVWAPFAEAEEQRKLTAMNEDSSNRKRSSSLTDNSNRRRERIVSGNKLELHRQSSQQQGGGGGGVSACDPATYMFHQELTETCVDLMARYAFADCSPLPQQFESCGFLVAGGNAQSWIVDNRIITVRTSGCTQRELREGLCDKCWSVCSKSKLVIDGDGDGDQGEDDEEKKGGVGVGGSGVGVKRSYTISGGNSSGASAAAYRRRHRSAVARSMSQDDSNLGELKKEGVMVGGGVGGGSKTHPMCGCWCQGWAEVMIRRPTGNTSWMMRVQNPIGGVRDGLDARELSSLYAIVCGGDTAGSGSKSPVRRTNSSPDEVKEFDRVEEGEEGSGGGGGGTQGGMFESIPEETPAKPISEPQSPDHVHLTPVKRDRMFTISVMTPATRMRSIAPRKPTTAEPSSSSLLRATPDVGIRSGISPSFVFLQLCGQGIIGGGGCGGPGGFSKPIPLPCSEATDKSLKVLDYIPPYETHKIGVMYVGPGQARDESAILQNAFGNIRYRDFVQGLGSLIKLCETDPASTFLGGLDGRGGEDGEFACIWQDDVMQVIFHVATLMPTRIDRDPNCNGKKRHIGNDFVAIVYNNSEEDFDISVIKCQFLYACVIIQPLDHKTNRVFVKAKPSIADNIGNTDVKIVSDQNLPIMARQLALHTNLASTVFHRRASQTSEPYASNWLERLRAIKRLRARVLPESLAPPSTTSSATMSTSSSATLSLSNQELTDMSSGFPVAGGSGGLLQQQAGGAPYNQFLTGQGQQQPMVKRPSFVVEDFTEYV